MRDFVEVVAHIEDREIQDVLDVKKEISDLVEMVARMEEIKQWTKYDDGSIKDRVTHVEEEVKKWTKYDDSILTKAVSDMASRAINDDVSYRQEFNNINTKIIALQRDMIGMTKIVPVPPPQPTTTTTNNGSYEQLLDKVKKDVAEKISKQLNDRFNKALESLRADITKDTKAMYVDLLLKK
jgi:BMFP domain-containing protein YqiC